jgi:glycogen debranching enzyme
LRSLSSEKTSYYAVRFFLTPLTAVHESPQLSVVRERALGNGVHEDIEVLNHRPDRVEIELEVELDADFRDLFEVKDALPPQGEIEVRGEDGELVFSCRRGAFERATVIGFSRPASITPGRPARALLAASIPAKGSWSVCMTVAPVVDRRYMPKYVCRTMREPQPEMEESFEEWLGRSPRLRTDWDNLKHAYATSVVDLAALRFFPGPGEGAVPAAGLPWFMALFGRDSIITSLQTVAFMPELARCTLKALARRQATAYDDFRDAEPGKIPHEERHGPLTLLGERPHSPYYGSADATPLYLVLLDEYERWTGDAELVRELEPVARAALAWIDGDGDRDGDGFVEYERRSPQGLDNHCWKDSWNSILFADGTPARPPLAVVEIQGYAVAAKRACARLAERIWGDEALAVRLRAEAEHLVAAIDQAFWLPERQAYALALDRDKRPVDSLTSNIGHLLWAGACPPERAASIRDRLMGEELFCGWGVRTMSSADAGFNPIEYHNGTVWPHDSSLIAAGLARYGFREEANRIATALIEAAAHFQWRLPEVFAGYPLRLCSFPVRYPTASSPQAWAAGAPLLLLSAMLGLQATADGKLRAQPRLPAGVELIELAGLRHRGHGHRLLAGADGFELASD